MHQCFCLAMLFQFLAACIFIMFLIPFKIQGAKNIKIEFILLWCRPALGTSGTWDCGCVLVLLHKGIQTTLPTELWTPAFLLVLLCFEIQCSSEYSNWGAKVAFHVCRVAGAVVLCSLVEFLRQGGF